jgi:hypothetical protein
MLLACGVAHAAAADVEQTAKRVIERTNAFRKAQGLQPVQVNAQLRAAQRYDACIVSENIAYLYRSQGYDAPALAREMVEGWKQSPEHREAMVDPAVSQIGVGIAQSASGRYYGVQMFGRPKSAAIRFSVRNQAGRPIRYRTGGQRFSLPPRAERTHTVCRRLELAIDAGKPFNVRPGDGARYVVIEKEGRLAVNPSEAR